MPLNSAESLTSIVKRVNDVPASAVGFHLVRDSSQEISPVKHLPMASSSFNFEAAFVREFSKCFGVAVPWKLQGAKGSFTFQVLPRIDKIFREILVIGHGNFRCGYIKTKTY